MTAYHSRDTYHGLVEVVVCFLPPTPFRQWRTPALIVSAISATHATTEIAIPIRSVHDSYRSSTTCSPAGIATERSNPSPTYTGAGRPAHLLTRTIGSSVNCSWCIVQLHRKAF